MSAGAGGRRLEYEIGLFGGHLLRNRVAAGPAVLIEYRQLHDDRGYRGARSGAGVRKGISRGRPEEVGADGFAFLVRGFVE